MRSVDIEQRGYRETLCRASELGGADLVLTSPPYEDARTYGADVGFTLSDYQALGDVVFEALRPGGPCLLNLDGPVRDARGLGSERSLMPYRVALDWSDRVGFRHVERLVYGRRGLPGEYRGRFRNDTELLSWFVRPGGEVFFDKACLAEQTEPYAGKIVT